MKVKNFVLPLLCVLQFFFLMVAFEQQAHAYVDPGSGLLIFQIVGSMVTGALFMLRSKLRKLFHRNSSNEETSSTPSSTAVDRSR